MRLFNFSLIVISSTIIGILIGMFLNHEVIQVNNTVDLLSGVSIFISILLVVYVSILFEKTREGARLKKELVLNKIEELNKNISTLNEMILSGSIKISELTLPHKKIYQEFQLVETVKKISKYEFDEFKTNFEKNHRCLRNLLGGTSQKSSQQSTDISIKNGMITYSESRDKQINQSFQKIKNLIIKEQIRIASI